MQNRIQTLLEKSQKLENLVSKNDLNEEFSAIISAHRISSTSKLKDLINGKIEKDRDLKLGIIGAVKAGKSSFLNALLFNGENVLPKAATPMTAALTVLEYKRDIDGVEAVVEYYTKKDIEEIKERYKNCIQHLEKLENKHFLQLSPKQAKDPMQILKNTANSADETALRERARKLAKLEYKQDNADSYAIIEHYESMQESGINPNSLSENETIKASSNDELNQKLKNFVGANGKFTPFTKSITLKLKENTLKDMQIIDTPGVNDPIVSREKQTESFLSNCDAVFFISTSGQFLNSSELDLLYRINEKNGILDFYIIASQVDTQLFGREINNDFNEALKHIKTVLNKQQKNVFKTQIKQLKEEEDILLDPTLEKIYKEISKNEVVINSAVCVELLKGETKDENAKLVLANLTEKFPAFFTQSAKKENLEKLANMSEVDEILKKIRTQKNEILQNRLNNLLDSTEKSLNGYQTDIKIKLQEKIEAIKNTDISELTQQINELENISEPIISASNEAFKQIVDELCKNISKTTKAKIQSFANENLRTSEAAKGERVDEGRNIITKAWFGFMRFFNSSYGHHNTINATRIRTKLEDTCEEIKDLVKEAFNEYSTKFEKDTQSTLRKALSEHIKKGLLNEANINSSIAKVLGDLKLHNDFNLELPYSLNKSGELLDSEANSYFRDARYFIETMQEEASKKTQESIENLKTELISSNIGEKLTQKYKQEQENLLANLQDRENSIKKYERILAAFLEVR